MLKSAIAPTSNNRGPNRECNQHAEFIELASQGQAPHTGRSGVGSKTPDTLQAGPFMGPTQIIVHLRELGYKVKIHIARISLRNSNSKYRR